MPSDLACTAQLLKGQVTAAADASLLAGYSVASMLAWRLLREVDADDERRSAHTPMQQSPPLARAPFMWMCMVYVCGAFHVYVYGSSPGDRVQSDTLSRP